MGYGWELSRIGTEHEKLQVERELTELRDRLARVPVMQRRREEIERELSQPWGEAVESEGADSVLSME